MPGSVKLRKLRTSVVERKEKSGISKPSARKRKLLRQRLRG